MCEINYIKGVISGSKYHLCGDDVRFSGLSKVNVLFLRDESKKPDPEVRNERY